MLSAVVALLRCPHCGGALELAGPAVRCVEGHSFDVARQGYVSLRAGGVHGPRGDSPEMIAARERFLAAGHFDAVSGAIADACAVAVGARREGAGVVLDFGAGTGHHLATTLERLPGFRGLALDVSSAALRRAARAHERIGAVGVDTWHEVPVAGGRADAILCVFAPRNAPEMERLLAPEGSVIVVTPTERHLGQLIAPLGLLSVDPTKAQRLDRQLAPHLDLEGQDELEYDLELDHAALADVAGMGPSAFHSSAEATARRIRRLPSPCSVTVSVTVSTYRRG